MTPASHTAVPGFQRIVPMAISVALFMENLDSTVISTALPVIARDLNVTSVSLSMAVSVYLLSLAIFIPMSGWMADRFGSRTVFASAIALFTLSSGLCGVAQSLPMLIGARALQGVGGAMMTPIGRLILGRTFAKRDLVAAMAYLTIPALIGPIVGPLVGGAITTYASWRWIFYVNLPIGIIGIIVVTRVLENFRDPDVQPPDIYGFFLLGIGLAGIVLGIENMGRGVLPQGVEVVVLVIATISFFLYWRHAKHVESPALDLTLFRIPTFFSSIIGGIICRLGIGAVPFLLPLLFQLGFHRTPLESGALTFTSAVGAILMKLCATPILRRFGFRNVLICNTLLVSGTIMLVVLFRSTTPMFLIVAVLTVSGFFRALQYTCLGALTYADLDSKRLSSGTSISSMLQQISVSMGVAIGATVLDFMTRASGAASPNTAAFTPTFLIVGAIPLASILIFARLPVSAAEEMSGHRKMAPAANHDDLGEPVRLRATE